MGNVKFGQIVWQSANIAILCLVVALLIVIMLFMERKLRVKSVSFSYGLGKLLQRKRIDAGLSERQMAKQLKISTFALKRIERGRADITLYEMKCLGDFYGSSIDDIIKEMN